MEREYTLDRAGNGSGMPTPWGRAQMMQVIEPGFMQVETASHGGFLLSRAFAESQLSEAGRKVGKEFGNWLAYEEDCDAAVIFWELWGRMGELGTAFKAADVEASLKQNLPEYLAAREETLSVGGQ